MEKVFTGIEGRQHWGPGDGRVSSTWAGLWAGSRATLSSCRSI